jgi:hypothetical protein
MHVSVSCLAHGRFLDGEIWGVWGIWDLHCMMRIGMRMRVKRKMEMEMRMSMPVNAK